MKKKLIKMQYVKPKYHPFNNTQIKYSSKQLFHFLSTLQTESKCG